MLYKLACFLVALTLISGLQTNVYAESINVCDTGGGVNVYQDNPTDINVLDEVNPYRVEEEFSFTFQGAENIKFDIWGTLNYPTILKSDKVFIFIHGRMRFNENAHLGFNYIMDKLCELGYRTISINICELYHTRYNTNNEISNVIKTVNRTLELIKNSKKDFGEIKTISFVGHSRGGFHVLKVSEVLMKKGYKVENVLSIAPCVLDWSRSSLPNTEVTILVPEFDGDVTELDGCRLYNETLKSNRNALLRCIYLFGGNHNFFSTEMPSDDTELLKNSENYKGYKISKEEQQKFLLDVILKYMTIEENQDIQFDVLYNCREFDFSKGYKKLKCIDLKSFNSYFWTVDTDSNITSFCQPGYDDETCKVLNFNREDNYILLDILNDEYSELLLEIALDSTKIQDFISAENIKLEIELIYLNGDKVIHTLTPLNIKGENISKGKYDTYWSRKIPFEQFYIDLNGNSVLDKINIKCNTFAQFVFNTAYIK